MERKKIITIPCMIVGIKYDLLPVTRNKKLIKKITGIRKPIAKKVSVDLQHNFCW